MTLSLRLVLVVSALALPGAAKAQGEDGSAEATAAPSTSCNDRVRNGGESDVDCGGGRECPACGGGRACNEDKDCASGACDRTNPNGAARCLEQAVRAERRAWSVDVGVGAMAHYGFQPPAGESAPPASPGMSFTFAPSLVVLFGPRSSWGFLLTGGSSARALVTNDDYSGVKAEFHYGMVGVCVVALDHSIGQLLACGGALVGYLESSDLRPDSIVRDEPFVGGPFGGGRFSIGDRSQATTKLFPYLGMNLAVPLARAGFTSKRLGTVARFETSPVSFVGEAGIALRFH